MTIDQIVGDYILTDGQVISLNIYFKDEPSAIVTLKARKRNSDNSIGDVIIDLRLNSLTHFDTLEDFESEYYSDLTLTRLANGEYYLSFDPYDNSNHPNERDNFVFKCKNLTTSEK
jgi:hypothetical protein